MSVKISYKNTSSKQKNSNLVLFVDEKLNISRLKKYILESEYSYISDLIKVKESKQKIINFDLNSKKKIILVSIKSNSTVSDIEKLGAKFYDCDFKSSR